jgi:tyrosyl-tRNA synthetase
MNQATFPPVPDQMDAILRGVQDAHVPAELEVKLKRSRETSTPLRVKVGFDPTAPDLHLGHTVVMHKMRVFQRLGHHVTFLIGDFTALIGDPSGRTATRPPLTRDQINQNAETYKAQVFKILDPHKTAVRFNSEWLAPLGFEQLIRLASHVTVAQMLEREDFKARLADRRPLSLHEILYPLSQAYDSVALNADVEMGGSDQLFNLMLGRDLMRAHGQEPQVILTTPLLEGTDAAPGGRKMSKTYGNFVGVQEPPDTQVLKLMGISDDLMWRYQELLSDRSSQDLAALKDRTSRGEDHPRDVKLALARELVTRFHGADAAQAAINAYLALADGDALPPDTPSRSVTFSGEGIPGSQLVVELGWAKSRREAEQRIKQGALRSRVAGTGPWATAQERQTLSWPPESNLEVRFGKRDYACVRRTPA